MRRAQKRQIEETIRQIEKVHDEIKKCIGRGNVVQAEKLLADCQNAAIAIGTLIEDTEWEGHLTVTVLEEYCELVYQIHESLASDGSVNANKIYKFLCQKLTKAENSVKNEIKIRMTAVFLPYKASMWDSLESVWKAADADPDCHAYVIPIPYFDKNPDGSFKEEHYEGDLYPEYVPVTRYDEYDLEAEHPDVIYIHNPYDECNYVTSIHPYFYSKNLRNYTDNLVYIPYFVLGEIEPDNQVAIEGMKHFCFTPGTIYADQVVVQSENMRQIYINEYIKAAKEAGLGREHVDRKFLEKKFLGIGSPKIDSVLNTKKEDLEIPQGWLKIIEKPDGSWKKIIFYNTSVGALLQHSEKMLKKMESVFSIFKENKDEVALLWRPHPLIQATVESMRPQLWKKYRQIVELYQNEGWGIYDDTADVDRAITLSDVYYGDSSSIIPLCKIKGMRMMIQNVDIIGINNKDEGKNDHGRIPFAVSRGILLENEFWCISHFFDGLWKYNLLLKKLSYVINLPEKNDIDKDAYSEMLTYKEQLILIPAFSDCMIIYNTRTGAVKEINLETIILNKNLWRWAGGFIYNNYLVLYPAASKSICRIDLESYDVSFLDMEKYLSNWNYNNMVFHLDSGCESEGKIYIPLARQNRVLILDIADLKIFCLEIESKESYFCGATVKKDCLFLAPEQKGAYIEYNLGTHTLKYVEKYPIAYTREAYRSVCAMISGEDFVEIVPSYGNMFLRMSAGQLQEDKIWRKWIQNKNERSRWASNELMFEKVIPLENRILLVSGRFNTVVIWVQKTNKIIDYEIVIDEVYKLEKYRNWKSTWEIERYIFSLEDVIQCIYGVKTNTVNVKKDIGSVIYQSSNMEL